MAVTPTYVPLATVDLTSSAGWTFSSLPATYRDVVMVVAGVNSTQVEATVYFNGDTTTGNYSRVWMLGTGSSTSSGTTNGENGMGLDTTQFVETLQIMDYSATDKHKTSLLRDARSAYLTAAVARRWANTAAITSIAVTPLSGTFTGKVSLYGIH